MARMDNEYDERNFVNQHGWPLTDEFNPLDELPAVDDEEPPSAQAA